MIVNEFVEPFLGFSLLTLVYLILPVLCLLLFSYLSIYKTEAILQFLKIDVPSNDKLIDVIPLEEERSVLSKEIVFKAGVFLIGIYLLASNAPNVIIRVIQWFTKELSQVKGNSLDDLLNMVSPYNTDTLLYSLSYTVAGYLIAVNHSKITAYFLKKKNSSE